MSYLPKIFFLQKDSLYTSDPITLKVLIKLLPQLKKKEYSQFFSDSEILKLHNILSDIFEIFAFSRLFITVTTSEIDKIIDKQKKEISTYVRENIHKGILHPEYTTLLSKFLEELDKNQIELLKDDHLQEINEIPPTFGLISQSCSLRQTKSEELLFININQMPDKKYELEIFTGDSQKTYSCNSVDKLCVKILKIIEEKQQNLDLKTQEYIPNFEMILQEIKNEEKAEAAKKRKKMKKNKNKFNKAEQTEENKEDNLSSQNRYRFHTNPNKPEQSKEPEPKEEPVINPWDIWGDNCLF